MTPKMKERFFDKIELIPFHSCWEWTAAKHDTGYGIFGIGNGKVDRAHRISYRLHKGDIPRNLVICHHCDNRTCVNPNHLFLGTHKDNHMDMVNKGRDSKPPPMGGWNKKNIPNNVIKLLGLMSDTEIGRKFGFCKSVIARERRRLNIKPFPCQTRFKSGDPHPCWSRKRKEFL